MARTILGGEVFLLAQLESTSICRHLQEAHIPSAELLRYMRVQCIYTRVYCLREILPYKHAQAPALRWPDRLFKGPNYLIDSIGNKSSFVSCILRLRRAFLG